MSHSDFGSFGLFAGNCRRGILGVLQHYRQETDVAGARVEVCFVGQSKLHGGVSGDLLSLVSRLGNRRDAASEARIKRIETRP
jgi:hypothetical protein